jgi:Putative peptidoglycan binding domain
MNIQKTKQVAVAISTVVALTLPGFALAESPSQTSVDQTRVRQERILRNISEDGRHMGSTTNDRMEHDKAMSSSTPKGDRVEREEGPKKCLKIVRSLRRGSRGDDVRQLQDLLAQDPAIFANASSTGFFGKATEEALARYQEKFGIASSSAQGKVGPKTREFLKKRCLAGGDAMMHDGSMVKDKGDKMEKMEKGDKMEHSTSTLVGTTTPVR